MTLEEQYHNQLVKFRWQAFIGDDDAQRATLNGMPYLKKWPSIKSWSVTCRDTGQVVLPEHADALWVDENGFKSTPIDDWNPLVVAAMTKNRQAIINVLERYDEHREELFKRATITILNAIKHTDPERHAFSTWFDYFEYQHDKDLYQYYESGVLLYDVFLGSNHKHEFEKFLSKRDKNVIEKYITEHFPDFSNAEDIINFYKENIEKSFINTHKRFLPGYPENKKDLITQLQAKALNFIVHIRDKQERSKAATDILASDLFSEAHNKNGVPNQTQETFLRFCDEAIRMTALRGLNRFFQKAQSGVPDSDVNIVGLIFDYANVRRPLRA